MPNDLRTSVIGTGDVGSALIELLASAGHRVVIGSRRSADALPDALRDLVAADRAEVRPVGRAAEDVDVVFLAVPWHGAAETMREAAMADGTIVVDTTNYNAARDGAELDPGPGGTTDVLARDFPALRWVKSFNMLWTGFLREDTDPASPSRVVLVAADDADAKQTVATLIAAAGFVAFDNGTLADARARQLQGTPAWNVRLDPEEARRLFPTAPGPMAPSR